MAVLAEVKAEDKSRGAAEWTGGLCALRVCFSGCELEASCLCLLPGNSIMPFISQSNRITELLRRKTQGMVITHALIIDLHPILSQYWRSYSPYVFGSILTSVQSVGEFTLTKKTEKLKSSLI